MNHSLPESNPNVWHETTDVTARTFGSMLAAFFVVAVVIYLALTGIYRGLQAHEAKAQTPLSTVWQRRNVPPAPRLQAAPAEDESLYRARQEATLNSYGWTNRTAGKTHIPIDRAMDLVAKP